MRLGEAMRHLREVDGRGVRAFAADIGISYPTLCRIERGGDCDLPALVRLLVWLTRSETGTSR